MPEPIDLGVGYDWRDDAIQAVLPIVNDAGAERESLSLIASCSESSRFGDLLQQARKVLASVADSDWVLQIAQIRVERCFPTSDGDFVWEISERWTHELQKVMHRYATKPG